MSPERRLHTSLLKTIIINTWLLDLVGMTAVVCTNIFLCSPILIFSSDMGYIASWGIYYNIWSSVFDILTTTSSPQHLCPYDIEGIQSVC